MLNSQDAKKHRVICKQNENNKLKFNNLKEELMCLRSMHPNKLKILALRWQDVHQKRSLEDKQKQRILKKVRNKKKDIQEIKLKHWKYYRLNTVGCQIVLWKHLTATKKVTLRKNEILIINQAQERATKEMWIKWQNKDLWTNLQQRAKP